MAQTTTVTIGSRDSGHGNHLVKLRAAGVCLEAAQRQEDALISNDLLALLPASRVEKFAYADKLSKDKDSMRQTISFWLSYWRDVMLRTAQAQMPLVNVDRNLEIEDLAGRMDLSSARSVVGGLEDALEKLERNVNPRLLAEVLLLDLPKV